MNKERSEMNRFFSTMEETSFSSSGLHKSNVSISDDQNDDDDASILEHSGDTYLQNMKERKGKMILNSSNNIANTIRRPASSPHLALDQMEFNKAFLILSYCGKKKLEDVITVDMIYRMKDHPMVVFESELWRVLGHQYIEEADRVKNLDWDSEGTFIYKCHVDFDGSCMFKGPYLQDENTHFQRVLGDSNVLLVNFGEGVVAGNRSGVLSDNSSDVYHRIAKEGINVGLRRYQFYAFKVSDKEKKKKGKGPTSSSVKCYFVFTGSNTASNEKHLPCTLFNKSIREARCLFMHIHTISSMAKFMARFSLILSKTLKFEIDFASVHIERIEDKPCLDVHGRLAYNQDGEAQIHTDGTGFISEDLALRCPRNIYKGKCLSQGDFEEKNSELKQSKSKTGEPPLLILIRLFINGCAVKGTLLVNKQLPPRTIQIRPSMIKVESDPELLDSQTANSLEIVSTSNKPKRTTLSRTLIALLSYGGVPKNYFMELLQSALEASQNVQYDERAALAVAIRHGEEDDFLLSRMILCGIPLHEPYLRQRLTELMGEEGSLKKGKIPVTECYFLMGTSDPTGTLNMDEVCIILEDGQISGKVLVYKYPGLHFGDIHVLNATYVKELEDVVGNAKYGIFFPTKGPRSLADEMANSDFDGDMYWVSRNPQLLSFFKASEPWTQNYASKHVLHQKPTQFCSEELEYELFQRFLTARFNPSFSMGIAADCWLVLMDRILTLGDKCAKEKECVKQNMLQLIDIYYDALDAPKSGKKVEVPNHLKVDKYPHFMERNNSYQSKSVLGQIHDKVVSFKIEEMRHREIGKLSCFSGEVPEASMQLWKGRYAQYRNEMSCAMKLGEGLKAGSASAIIMTYKQMLYNAAGFHQSTRKREEIFNEALAIYRVTYDHAENCRVSSRSSNYQEKIRCSFAWKVAGRALCELLVVAQNDDPIVCLKSVLPKIIN